MQVLLIINMKLKNFKQSLKIAIIEDEEAIAELLEYIFAEQGFKIIKASTGEDAISLIYEELPNIVILDWMLPDIPGTEVLKELKTYEETKQIPIIMCSARKEDEDKIRGLDIGADDYVAKPFSPKELLLRVQAILKRTQPEIFAKKIEHKGLEILTESKKIYYNGKEVKLSTTEFAILLLFASTPNKIYSKEALFNKIWEGEYDQESRVIDVTISRLRKKLHEASPQMSDIIKTIHNVGYQIN